MKTRLLNDALEIEGDEACVARAENILTDYVSLVREGHVFNNGDPVPVLGNKLKFISNLVLPWNNGRSSAQNIERQDVDARGLNAHGFEYYEEAVKKWAEHFKEQQVYTALPSSY